MTEKERNLQKKSMTKKQLSELNKMNRSEFATAKMGVRIFKDEKAYDRNKEKAKVSRKIRDYA